MRRRHYSVSRNKLDLSNPVQVKIVRKRLKVSEDQLIGLVRKAGDSLAAVRKEADLQRQVTVPPVEVIAPAQEPTVAETVEERAAAAV